MPRTYESSSHVNHYDAGQSRISRSLERQITLAILSVLVIGTFVLLSTALGGEILFWDDEINLWHTPQINSLDLSSLAWMFTDTEQVLRYKPICWLLWASMIHIFGEASPFRLLNLILHTTNAVLIFFLIIGFHRNPNERNTLMPLGFAGCLAAIWAWVPARIEPVTWISGLGYPLALSFTLGSAILFQLYLSRPKSITKSTALRLSLLSWTLGTLSYPSALCILPLFPVLILASNEPRPGWKSIIPVSGHLMIGLTIASGTLASRVWSYGSWSESALSSISLNEQFARMLYFPIWILGRLNPTASVGPIYDSLTSPSLNNPLIWASGTALFVVTFALFCIRSRIPILLWVSFLVSLVPHIGFTEHLFIPTDRYAYTPSIFILLLSSSLIQACQHSVQKWILTILSTIAVIALPVTWIQSDVWRTNDRLFNRGYEKAETARFQSEMLIRNGRVEHARGNQESAERYFLRSSAIAPNDTRPLFFLAKIYTDQGRFDEAAEQYRCLIEVEPDDISAANNFGFLLIRMARPIEAIEVLQRAARCEPSPLIITNLATAYARAGALEKAYALLSYDICAKWLPAARLRESLEAGEFQSPRALD